MSVNLSKGQKVDLTKGKPGLSRVTVGLGWDEAQPEKKGFFGKSKPVQAIDCDAIVFLLDDKGNIRRKEDVVFFNNLKHVSGCVNHQGDNLTGEGEGDDEQVLVDLKNLPQEYDRLVILVSIYDAEQRNQQFGMIKNAFIRLVDASNGNELCIYNLSENYDDMTALVFGELYRKDGEWKFNAVGQPLKVWSVAALAERYGLPREVWHKK